MTYLFVALFGAIFGSFFNCALYRLPRGQSLRWPPSQCPHCQHRLGVVDLAPLLSWLCLRGKCRHCQHPIGLRYFLVEVLMVSVSVLTAAVVGPTPWLLAILPCAWGGVFLALFYAKVGR